MPLAGLQCILVVFPGHTHLPFHIPFLSEFSVEKKTSGPGSLTIRSFSSELYIIQLYSFHSVGPEVYGICACTFF